MKRIMLLIILSSYSQTIFSQKCKIQDNLGEIFTLQFVKMGKAHLPSKNILATLPKSLCEVAIYQNRHYWFYLHEHFSAKLNISKFSNTTDSTATKKEYIANLQKDSAFVNILQTHLHKVQYPQNKDSVSIDELLDIAVKFFSLNLGNQNQYNIKICSGINDIEKTLPTRKPFVEAFCFASIFENHKTQDFNMVEEVVRTAKELYKFNFGNDRNEKILRSQGALYVMMKNNEKLRRMLLKDYEKHKAHLPFVLKI